MDDRPSHQVLWAPWRMGYIARADETNAGRDIFLDLPNEEDDERNLILHRGETAFVMMNAHPYASGHLMVAPFRATSEIVGMSDAELLEINRLVARCVGWLTAAYRPHGFNIGVNLGSAGGAGIPVHIHWHVVPRWSGDTNFMTSVGGTRVLPESLADGYARLRRVIAAEEEVSGVNRS